MNEANQHEARRVAVVTGASRGLGEVIAGVLVDRGYDIVIGARDGRPLADIGWTGNHRVSNRWPGAHLAGPRSCRSQATSRTPRCASVS